MWYDVPVIDAADWLPGVVGLFGDILNAIIGFPVLRVFTVLLLFAVGIAVFFLLSGKKRK